MSALLDGAELGAFIGARFREKGDIVFRMELLPAYAVDSDGDDYQRWLDGEPAPTSGRKQPTLDRLAAAVDAGMEHRRVRVFDRVLTDYGRYACEFGYQYNVPAGEDVRVLRHGEHEVPPLLGFDYWLINEGAGARMHYDECGRFEGAEIVTPQVVRKLVAERDATWALAEPFLPWWKRHNELLRRKAA